MADKKRIPPEERSRQLQYYYDHREERVAYSCEYARKHREAAAAHSTRYREKNREKLQSYQKAYYQAHKEAIKARAREKRAAAGGANSGDGMGNENKAIIAGKKGNVNDPA